MAKKQSKSRNDGESVRFDFYRRTTHASEKPRAGEWGVRVVISRTVTFRDHQHHASCNNSYRF